MCVHRAASWVVECNGCGKAAILGAFSQCVSSAKHTRFSYSKGESRFLALVNVGMLVDMYVE